MIIYDKLWETMKKRGVTKYALIKKHHINELTIQRLRKNMPTRSTTLDRLCEILDCKIEDICEYIENDTDLE